MTETDYYLIAILVGSVTAGLGKLHGLSVSLMLMFVGHFIELAIQGL